MKTEKIIANEILGLNDWNQISLKNLTLEQMKQFKTKLNWEYIFTGRNVFINKIDNQFIDELIKEKIIKYDKDDYSAKFVFAKMAQNFVTELWFAKKYKDCFSMKTLAYNRKFKASELIQIYGKPEVGTGVTHSIGSDSYPYTVIESNPKGLKIKIQRDDAIAIANSDYYGDQKYEFKRNPNGEIVELKLNSKGMWVGGFGSYTIGVRNHYLNPSF